MRALRAAFRVGVAALVLSGCRTISLSDDPNASDRNVSIPAVYQIDWWVRLVEPKLWEYSPREAASPAIDPDAGLLLVATRDGYVRAITLAEGKVAWEFRTGGPFNAGPLVAEGVAYAPSGDGALYALKSASGALLWKYEAGEELATVPVLAAGKVLVGSSADTLYAVNAASGKWEWQYRRDSPSGFTIRGSAAPVVGGAFAYVGFADGYLVALNVADGSTKWEKALSGAAKQFFDVDTTPVLDESGQLYVASYQHGIFALSAETGGVVWQRERAGVTGLNAQGDVLYATGQGQLAALRFQDGRALWTLDIGNRAAQPAAFTRGALLVPVDTALLFVDPVTGRPRTAFDPGNGVSATPALEEGRLYVLSNRGYLYAMSLD